MPNWKKVIVSGSDAILNSITVSETASFLNDSVVIEGNSTTVLEVDGDVSASGDLYIEGLENASGDPTNVVVYDTTTGQFYYTSSYVGADSDWAEFDNYITSSRSIIVTGSITASGGGSFLEDGVTISTGTSAEIYVGGNITASGNISASGHLFASTSNSSGNYNSVVVIDTSSGQFYYTGSYGGGGGGGGYVNIQIGSSPSNIGATISAEDGPDAYLRFITGSNISLSATEGTNDNVPTTPDILTIQAIPSPSDTFIQYNSASVFHGTESLRFEAEGDTDSPGSSSFRTGKKDPSTNGNDFGNYGGSHLLNDDTELVTNATYAHDNAHYHLLGFAGRSTSKSKPGGGTYTAAGTYRGMGLTGGNGPIPASLSPDAINSKNLQHDIISGDLMLGGPYIHFDPTKGFNIYANNFISIPGSPATTLGSDGFVIYPSASCEYNESGSFLTPLTSASGRIVIDEAALPQNSTLDIIGRKTTQFKTGDSGSELNYLIYESSTGTIGIGKGLSTQNVKDEGTSVNAFISGGIKITGSSTQDDIRLLTTGGLQVHPSTLNAADGDYNRFFPFGQIGTKQGSFRGYPNNPISRTPALYYDFSRPNRGGTTSRTLVVEDSNLEISKAKTGTSEGVKGGILFTSNPNIYFFNETDASASLSGSLLEESASAQIKFNTASSSIQFLAGSTNETLKEVLFISKSGNNPRIGIGTDDPKGVFDFKDIGDTATGAELLLRSARSSEGALSGDDGGTINFAIDSGSFNDLKTSGSLAKIKTKVNSIGTGGAQGKLIFELSKAAGGTTVDVFEYGFNIGGQALFASVQTASLVIKDFSSGGESIFQMRDFDDNVRFEVNDGDVEISGSLGVTGSATFNSGITSTALTLTSPPVQGSEGTSLMINGSGVVGTRELGSIAFFQGNQNLRQLDSPTFEGLTVNGTASIAYFETLYETSSIIYSSGSTKFGDTMDDFHDFTGSVDITGSIVASNLSGTNTGDQDLSSYSTIVQLNASSSALQTNIDAKASITQLNASSSALQTNISTNTGNISTNTTNITSLTDTVSTVTTVIGSDAATNVDTFATSTYNGAIYDYILKDSTVGARAGQFMVAHDDGDVTFTDVSTKHLSDSTIPEITADISGGSTVRVRVTNGNGYTFKSFVKKL